MSPSSFTACAVTPPGVYVRTRKGQALVASRDLDGLPPEHGRMLAMLNGFTPVRELARLAERGGFVVDDLESVIGALLSAGLIEAPAGRAH